MNRCLVAIAVLACLMVGMGAEKRNEVTVTIKNLAFAPETVKIKVGDAVTWFNADDRDHNVTGEGILSGKIKPGRMYSQSFTKAGKYPYVCTLHPRMRGTVIVE